MTKPSSKKTTKTPTTNAPTQMPTHIRASDAPTAAPTVTPTAAPTVEATASIPLEVNNALVVHTFVRAIATRSGMLTRIKIEELGVANVRDAMVQASYGREEKHLMTYATRAYNVLSGEMSDMISTHFRSLKLDIKQSAITYSDLGSLDFKGVGIYLHNSAGYTMLASEENPVQAYMFLMFEKLNEGKKVLQGTNPEDTWATFSNKKNTKGYNNYDLLDKFVFYNVNGEKINLLEKQESGKQVVSPTAIKIFNKAKEAVKSIVEQEFKKYEEECNVLKDTPDMYRTVICSSLTRVTDIEASGKIALCLHTFKLAEDPALCGKVSASEIEHFEL